MRDGRATKRTARATDILNMGWPQQRCHPFGPRTAYLISRTAGRVRNHQPDRPRGIFIGDRNAPENCSGCDAGHGLQNSST
jgi:hypothetical protein